MRRGLQCKEDGILWGISTINSHQHRMIWILNRPLVWMDRLWNVKTSYRPTWHKRWWWKWHPIQTVVFLLRYSSINLGIKKMELNDHIRRITTKFRTSQNPIGCLANRGATRRKSGRRGSPARGVRRKRQLWRWGLATKLSTSGLVESFTLVWARWL